MDSRCLEQSKRRNELKQWKAGVPRNGTVSKKLLKAVWPPAHGFSVTQFCSTLKEGTGSTTSAVTFKF